MKVRFSKTQTSSLASFQMVSAINTLMASTAYQPSNYDSPERDVVILSFNSDDDARGFFDSVKSMMEGRNNKGLRVSLIPE